MNYTYDNRISPDERGDPQEDLELRQAMHGARREWAIWEAGERALALIASSEAANRHADLLARLDRLDATLDTAIAGVKAWGQGRAA